MPPPSQAPVRVRAVAGPADGGSDVAVEPGSLHAAARQLRDAAEALPGAVHRLRVALSAAAGTAGGSRCAPVLAEHAAATAAAVGALAERVLELARVLDASATRYRVADDDAVRPVVALPSQRLPR